MLNVSARPRTSAQRWLGVTLVWVGLILFGKAAHGWDVGFLMLAVWFGTPRRISRRTPPASTRLPATTTAGPPTPPERS